MNFFKTMLASLVGSLLAFGLVMVIFFIVIIAAISGAMSSASSANGGVPINVKENSILHIQFNQPIVERGSDNDFNFNPATFKSESNLALDHFAKDLKRAKDDDRIKGIFVEFESIAAAPSTLLDLRNAIKDFKTSGKWVLAYSESYTQGGYFVCSAADEVYLNPAGDFDWRGLNAEVMFYKKMLDKLEIEAQVIRGPDNKFKSAVEPFMYDVMSEPNRQQVKTFMDDIWTVMLENISADRNVSVESLMMYADSLSLIDPQNAVESNMINGLKYRDEIVNLLEERTGVDTTSTPTSAGTKPEKLHLISLADYHDAPSVKKEENKDVVPDFKKDKVAVVYAVGAIESGEGDDQTIGSIRIAKALREAREDEKVKAIVLRVNSPGGSALASDVIWRETQLIKQSGKPLVVSMGDYAASGGYYISCAADRIYANENTITGSIGVFGVVPNLQKFMDNKLGITFDRYETNPHADMISTSKPLDAQEMQAFQTMVSDIYDEFISKVAEGRGMEKAMVDSIGQGRVWSGEDAKALGLVDEIGGMDDAIKTAASLAKMTDYAVKDLPTMIDPIQELIEELTGKKKEDEVRHALGVYYPAYQSLTTLHKLKGIQARMPFELQIQ